MTKSQLLDEIDKLNQRIEELENTHHNSGAFGPDFLALASQIDDVIIIANPQGELIFMNSKMTEPLDVTNGDTSVKDVSLLFPVKYQTDIKNIFKKQSFPALLSISIKSQEGKVLSTVLSLREGEFQGQKAIFLVLKDHTTTKRLEVEISMLSHALKNVSESLSVFDLHGNIIFVNDAFVDTYGYPKEELIGKPIDLFHPPDIGQTSVFKPIIEQSIQGSWEGELTAQRKNGESFTISLRTSTVRNEDGIPIVVIGVSRDITQLKILEDQLRQSQKMEAIGQLAGGIAHDFNNLLTVIEGYIELLFSSIAESDPTINFVKQIKKASDRATSLTRQLLAFSRRQILQPKVIDLNALINEIMVLIKRLIGEDIELKLNLQKDVNPIRADRSQIEQVLMNLAVNARDAMPYGGTLTISSESIYLDTAYTRLNPEVKEGSYVILTVSDTGVGMDEEIKEHIFEPFFTTKDKARGTGLGLATVYGIVKQSDGYITVESEPGKGTEFKIYFPGFKKQLPKKEKDKKKIKTVGGHETIMVVEDEYMVRELVCDTLRNSGYKVIEATNGKEAIEIFEKNKKKIDMILTDVIMPEMSGRKLIETLSEKLPHLKALYMSGYTDDAIIRHGVLEPGMDYIQKPFTPKSLIQKIREVLTKK